MDKMAASLRPICCMAIENIVRKGCPQSQSLSRSYCQSMGVRLTLLNTCSTSCVGEYTGSPCYSTVAAKQTVASAKSGGIRAGVSINRLTLTEKKYFRSRSRSSPGRDTINLTVYNTKRNIHSSVKVNHTHLPKDVKRNCWKCGRNTNPRTELFFCDCGVVQKPAIELTYFDLMRLEETFDLDVAKLGNLFRDTQKRLHPDKFSTKSAVEQSHAEHQSSLLNKAYSVLQKPLSRAIYMLQLHGITIAENDTLTDPDFLMEIMEVNEQISSAKTSSDLEEQEKVNEERIDQCVMDISQLFKDKEMEKVKRTTIRLRYFITIQERIKELKIRELG